MLMKNNCAVFQFRDCAFEVQKDREGAARVNQLFILDCSLEGTKHNQLLHSRSVILRL
jgi:hypothetical protein